MSDTIMVDKERYKEEGRLLDLLLALTSYGSRDLATAADWLDEAGMDDGKFGEYVEELCKETDTPMADADIAAMALEYIAQETASELTGHVYGNYLCSGFDIDDEKAGEILYAIPEDERGDAWEFLVKMTNATKPKEEAE